MAEKRKINKEFAHDDMRMHDGMRMHDDSEKKGKNSRRSKQRGGKRNEQTKPNIVDLRQNRKNFNKNVISKILKYGNKVSENLGFEEFSGVIVDDFRIEHSCYFKMKMDGEEVETILIGGNVVRRTDVKNPYIRIVSENPLLKIRRSIKSGCNVILGKLMKRTSKERGAGFALKVAIQLIKKWMPDVTEITVLPYSIPIGVIVEELANCEKFPFGNLVPKTKLDYNKIIKIIGDSTDQYSYIAIDGVIQAVIESGFHGKI